MKFITALIDLLLWGSCLARLCVGQCCKLVAIDRSLFFALKVKGFLRGQTAIGQGAILTLHD